MVESLSIRAVVFQNGDGGSPSASNTTSAHRPRIARSLLVSSHPNCACNSCSISLQGQKAVPGSSSGSAKILGDVLGQHARGGGADSWALVR